MIQNIYRYIISLCLLFLSTLMPLYGSEFIKRNESVPLIKEGEDSCSISITQGSSINDYENKQYGTILRDKSADTISLELLNWINLDVLNSSSQQEKCADIAINIVGYYSALSRGALYGKLGYDLAMRFIHLGEIPNKILATVYGIGVAAPMTVLGLESSGDFIKAMIKKKGQREALIEVSECCNGNLKKCILTPPLIFISTISAATVTYLTYVEFSGLIGWFWLIPGVPNLYTRAAMDFLAIPIIGRAIYTEIERPINYFLGKRNPKGRRDNIYFIKNKLERATDYIFSLSPKEFNNFMEIYKKSQDPLAQCLMLMKPHLFAQAKKIESYNSWGRRLAALIGGAVGIVGLWVYFPATHEAFDLILSPLSSMLGSSAGPLSEGLTYTALISATSIMARSAASSATKFYDASTAIFRKIKGSAETVSDQAGCNSQSAKRIGAATLSAFLAAWNATQVAEVSLKFLDMKKIDSKIAFVASLLSFFSLSFWAVDEKFVKHFKKTDQKSIFISKIDIISQKINDIKDEHLYSLRNFLEADRAIV